MPINIIDYEKVRNYDLSQILEDCTYLDSTLMVNDIRVFWNKNSDYILNLILRDKSMDADLWLKNELLRNPNMDVFKLRKVTKEWMVRGGLNI